MLRTSNKRLHSNLWTWAHFLGSALVFLVIFGSCVYFEFKFAGGAQTTSVLSDTMPRFDEAGVLAWVFDSYYENPFFPISWFLSVITPFPYDDSGFATLLYGCALGLDCALWFNVLLWVLQVMLFVPDWAFHWLERKKEGD